MQRRKLFGIPFIHQSCHVLYRALCWEVEELNEQSSYQIEGPYQLLLVFKYDQQILFFTEKQFRNFPPIGLKLLITRDVNPIWIFEILSLLKELKVISLLTTNAFFGFSRVNYFTESIFKNAIQLLTYCFVITNEQGCKFSYFWNYSL